MVGKVILIAVILSVVFGGLIGYSLGWNANVDVTLCKPEEAIRVMTHMLWGGAGLLFLLLALTWLYSTTDLEGDS